VNRYLESEKISENAKHFVLKEFLDAKVLWKKQFLLHDPNITLENLLRTSSCNFTLMSIVFNYLLQEEGNSTGLNKIILVLDRYMLRSKQTGNEPQYQKLKRYYEGLLRNNCYKVSDVSLMKKEPQRK